MVSLERGGDGRDCVRAIGETWWKKVVKRRAQMRAFKLLVKREVGSWAADDPLVGGLGKRRFKPEMRSCIPSSDLIFVMQIIIMVVRTDCATFPFYFVGMDGELRTLFPKST